MKKVMLIALLISAASAEFNMQYIMDKALKEGHKMYNEYKKHSSEKDINTVVKDTVVTDKSGRHLDPSFPDTIFSKKNCDKVIKDKVWTSCYNQEKKISDIIGYSIKGDDLRSGNIKKRPKFYGDNRIKRKFRAEYKDYTRSGFDRGHARPHASTSWNSELLYHTYSMINIWPQRPSVNRHTWIKAEKYERLLARKLGGIQVLNIADTRGANQKIGTHGITVPTGFYKILYTKNRDLKKCFYYKNVEVKAKGDKIKDHLVDCSKIYY